MTIPAELVEAASLAMRRHKPWRLFDPCVCGEPLSPQANWDAYVAHLAQVALQAAFAKLPECKAAAAAVEAALSDRWTDARLDNESDPEFDAETALAALAQEFGGECEGFTTDSYVHAHDLGRVPCVNCGRLFQQHGARK